MGWLKSLLLFGILVIIFVGFFVNQHRTSQDSFVGDFESGNLSQWEGFSKINTTNSQITVVKDHVRRGQYGIKVSLAPNDKYPNDRAELVLHSGPGRSEPGDERYYSFSALIPEEFQEGGEHFLILAQWHGNDSARPPLTLHYQKGKLVIKGNRHRGILGSATVEKGKWFDMVFHVKWSTEEDGFLEVWKNGEQIVELRGETCNGTDAKNFRNSNIYVKFGGYRGRNVDITQTFYLDEYRIGDSYEAVTIPL